MDQSASAIGPYRAAGPAPIVLPRLTADGAPVDPHQCVEPGTGLQVTVGYLLVAVIGLVTVVSTFGVILLVALAGAIVAWFMNRRIAALLKGSGVRVGPRQLGALHDAAVRLAARLGMAAPPEIYVIEDNTINAFALRLGRRQFITLTDDLIDACVRTGNTEVLVFVLAHEMAHARLGHNRSVRGYLRTINRKLSRLDEYTADRVAIELVRDREVAVRGLALLAAGPYILPYVDMQELGNQAREVAADGTSRKAERILTHPLVLHRLHRVLGA